MQQRQIDNILIVMSRLIDQYNLLAAVPGNEKQCAEIDLKIHSFHKVLQQAHITSDGTVPTIH